MAIKTNGGVVQVVAFASYVKTDPYSNARNAAMSQLREQFGVSNPPAGTGGRGAGGGGRAGGAAGAAGAAGARGAAGAPAAAGAAPQGGGRGGAGCSVEDPNAAGRQGGRGGRGGGGGGRGAGGANAALDALTPEQRADYDRRLAKINAMYPAQTQRANVQDFVNHIDYAVKLIGIDHVGISSDFDGGGGVDGWNSAAETFNVTLELVRRGYAEEQIGKIWSGNLLRVWSEVEQVAKKIQAGEIK
jgi:membrane dipeptidase